MEPLTPEQKEQALRKHPQAAPEDIAEYERLLAARFSVDPSLRRSPATHGCLFIDELLLRRRRINLEYSEYATAIAFIFQESTYLPVFNRVDDNVIYVIKQSPARIALFSWLAGLCRSTRSRPETKRIDRSLLFWKTNT